MGLFFDPLWDEIAHSLIDGNSVMFHAPKHYGKNFFYRKLMLDPQFTDRYKMVTLTIPDDKDGLNFSEIFSAIIEQLGLEASFVIQSKFDLVNHIIEETGKLHVLYIIKSNQENVVNAAKVIDAFQEVMQKRPQFLLNRIVLLVMDDYSLYYYENTLREYSSRWDFFRRRTFKQFRSVELLQQKLNLILKKPADTKCLAEVMLKLTGGHQGFLIKLLNYISTCQHEIDCERFETEAKNQILEGDLYDSLRRLLFKKPKEFIQQTLSYKSKQLSEDYSDEVSKELHQLGIVIKVNGEYSILCPGIIEELVQNIYKDFFSRSKKLVLFVHGLGGDYTTWDHFQKLIESDEEFKKQWKTAIYKFPTRITNWTFKVWRKLPRIQHIAEGLKTEIENRHREFNVIVLVCHSLGGLVGREYLLNEVMKQQASELDKEFPVRKILMYATPHGGSCLANIGKYLSWRNYPIKQLCKNSEFLDNLNNNWTIFKMTEKVAAKFVIGGNDDVVDYNSAKGFWMNSATVINENHFSIIKPPDDKHLSYLIFKNFLMDEA